MRGSRFEDGRGRGWRAAHRVSLWADSLEGLPRERGGVFLADRHFPQPSLRTFYIFLSLHFVLSTETTTVLQPFSGKFSQGRGVPILDV